MPLRARIENKEVISTFLSKEEWSNLKDSIKSNNADVIIAQTNKKGYLRTSKLGLQHFVHKRGEKPDNWKPESQQHLLAKSEVLLGCKDAGWEAISEYGENDWIADVMAIKGKHRIVFEIQWSNQTFERTKERQSKYKQNNIRGCWFFKKPPKEFLKHRETLKADKEIPLFKICEIEKKEIWVDIYGRKIPIRQFTEALLKRKIKFCINLEPKINQKIKISFFETECWRCKTKQYIYFIQENLESKCGQSICIEEESWSNNALKYNPQILKAIHKFLKTEKGKSIRIGEIKKRYSKTIKSSYMSFGCCKCDSIFGDWFIQTEILEAKDNENNLSIVAEIQIPKIKVKHPHWCYSENNAFCEL